MLLPGFLVKCRHDHLGSQEQSVVQVGWQVGMDVHFLRLLNDCMVGVRRYGF